jgi:hypothetical protein
MFKLAAGILDAKQKKPECESFQLAGGILMFFSKKY